MIILFACHECSQKRNLIRSEALVREMEEQGIDASIDIYHTMMDGYAMVQNEEKCLMVFYRLKVNDYSITSTVINSEDYSSKLITFEINHVRELLQVSWFAKALIST